MIKPNTTIGSPPEIKEVYKTIFDFIHIVLSDFKPFSKDEMDCIVTSEDLITQDLEKTLNVKSHKTGQFFAFQNQSRKGRYTTDISVYKIASYYEDFCWIEAKRLPTPDAGNTRDEQEYVIVSQDKVNGKKKFRGNGGIQRFKEGKHASKHSRAIMIGYIQLYDPVFWVNKINGWISNLIEQEPEFWNENDYLQDEMAGKCYTYTSTHKRKHGLNQITLKHFWITV
ncbi:MAG: hypothetical protein U2P89_00430 [Proteiniphilum sp.]|uniref:hypothetical protein n=1 Tax=Proteiniphilum sp. TaxID=1926877 RepID=UPI002ABA0887|nr:hypothetical protein [Proteiniphilum sp.]MDY9917323.1 hypothetical protein [Proteiniphilum sp.]